MKYMLMFFGNDPDNTLEGTNKDNFNAHAEVSMELASEGRLVCMDRLHSITETTTILRQEGEVIAVDGPYAEGKEILGGYCVIEADSKDEAVALAKRFHQEQEDGGVEVRPARTGAVSQRPAHGKERYMLMFLTSDETVGQQSRSEVFDAVDRHYEWSLELAAEGKFAASRSLDHWNEAVTIRRNNGSHIATDGPFAEGKEQLAGFFVLTCDSRDEAIDWGKKLLHGLDAIEVRPVIWDY